MGGGGGEHNDNNKRKRNKPQIQRGYVDEPLLHLQQKQQHLQQQQPTTATTNKGGERGTREGARDERQNRPQKKNGFEKK